MWLMDKKIAVGWKGFNAPVACEELIIWHTHQTRHDDNQMRHKSDGMSSCQRALDCKRYMISLQAYIYSVLRQTGIDGDGHCQKTKANAFFA